MQIAALVDWQKVQVQRLNKDSNETQTSSICIFNVGCRSRGLAVVQTQSLIKEYKQNTNLKDLQFSVNCRSRGLADGSGSKAEQRI